MRERGPMISDHHFHVLQGFKIGRGSVEDHILPWSAVIRGSSEEDTRAFRSSKSK